MANNKIIEIRPGKGLDSGVYPTAAPSVGLIWKDAQNVWFRPLGLFHTLGRNQATPALGSRSRAMAQAFVDGERRLYYEAQGFVFKYIGNEGDAELIGELNSAGEGSYDLEPFGTWLIGTDNVNTVKLWKNDENGFAAIGESEFARGKIIKKLAQRVLVYNTDVLPGGFHYSKPSDVETWTPGSSTGAGNLPLRDLDSDIIAVAELSGAHAVYTADKMLVNEYLGESLKFGTPRQALYGIGAAGRDSVISRGAKNFGLFRGGIFETDGANIRLLDDPALKEWIQSEIDFDRGDEIIGYDDKRLGLLVWSVPLNNGGQQGIGYDMQGRFTFLDAAFGSAVNQEVFPTAYVSESGGIFEASLTGTVLGGFSALTHLLDAGTQGQYKVWDYLMFEGALSGNVRIGYTNEPSHDDIDWQPWEPLRYQVPIAPRESVFIALEFETTEAIQLTSIVVYGSMAGLVT